MPKPIEIIVAVRGGCIQGVRIGGVTPAEAEGYSFTVVDYDNHERDLGRDGETEADFERGQLAGRTWADIERTTTAIY